MGKGLIAIILITVLTEFMSSCSWVELSKSAEQVRVDSREDVTHCKKIANITATLRSKVLGIERNPETVKIELETLARNKATEYEGNSVVPSSEIVEGTQTFDVFKCP
jgi:hypothetical protein